MWTSCWLLGVLIACDPGICVFNPEGERGAKTPDEADQIPATGQQEPVTDRPKVLFYSEWSSWTPCGQQCERTRERRCQDPKKCGNIVLKETDLCPALGDRRNRRKCLRAQNRRKHRHKTDEFHVVRIPPTHAHNHTKTQTLREGKGTNRKSKNPQDIGKQGPNPRPSVRNGSKSFHVVRIPRNSTRPESRRSAKASRKDISYHTVYNQWARMADNYYRSTSYPYAYPAGYFGWSNQVNHAPPSRPRESAVIFPSAAQRPNGERLTAYESKLYGKWSRWSQCSRSCTTHRRRTCKRKDLCGNTMLKESAYCYVEDSYCQRWIRRKLQGHDETNEAIQEYQMPDTGREGKGRSSSAFHAAYTGSADGECGVAGNVSKSLSNMLRIIGGRPTAKGRWPWQVAVLNRYREAFCGGTLVSPRWVLTAAHCMRKRLYVRVGEHDLSRTDGSETEYRIDQMIRHPSYDEETVDNDLALLHLPEPVDGVLACLPRSRQPLPTDRYCTIIGWGKRISSDTFGTDVLHEAEVPIVGNDVCRHVYEDYHITDNMFCAGYRRGRMDSCAGDSGGPLLCKDGHRWTIFGITSFGEGCGKHGKYGIYTRVPNFVRWIRKIVKD